MDWYEANRTCAESRANLAIPTSQSEQDYIWELFMNEFDQTPSTSLWIDCNDIEEEGKWQHQGYGNWANGEPNNGGDSDCVKMWDTRNGQWDDTQCSRKDIYAVCMQHVKNTPVST
ncbi:mannose-binding protein-like [Asterias rubens]|uniref:mannose-binding protein-like n=1 Tax=Asterias rubens TaxID=7604 RepID=UPI0014555C88|nr:mannose-binding protein-like [Asterias rubens]